MINRLTLGAVAGFIATLAVILGTGLAPAQADSVWVHDSHGNRHLPMHPSPSSASLNEAHWVPAWQQPYGGCDEALFAPHSRAATECRNHGWTITPHIVVGPRGWVRAVDMPACNVEDGSSGPLPCAWNFVGLTGNGLGKAYWVDRNGGVHYVKGLR